MIILLFCRISKHRRALSIVWWVFVLSKLDPQKTTIAIVQSAQQMSTKEVMFVIIFSRILKNLWVRVGLVIVYNMQCQKAKVLLLDTWSSGKFPWNFCLTLTFLLDHRKHSVAVVPYYRTSILHGEKQTKSHIW